MTALKRRNCLKMVIVILSVAKNLGCELGNLLFGAQMVRFAHHDKDKR
jgi:hypothetical protein